ncbi:MAG TPA: NrfD/PsrC family molybdoenzyme membrane anchor subunit [Anaerolineales bacterium]|nr:NrfD/PsrC family molybdoenzyme membrane anchor subunit [Anaerolineales bacterium]
MEDREAVLFKPMEKTGRGFYLVVSILGLILAWAAFAYSRQLAIGLDVTGLNRPVYWGLYITNFVFFIGISHAGTLVSAILRVFGAEWRRPITRAAEAITVFALVLGTGNIMIDMGRPDRLLNILRYGRFQSPLVWDVVSLSIYLTASLTYLYLPLIPDLAILRDRPSLPRWRQWLYTKLSLGWTGTEVQKHRLERLIGIMAVLIIPIAVSVHTVVSWVFAMTVQPMWHSTIFGPYFVIGAIFSGIATLIIVMAILRRSFKLYSYITDQHFSNLGLLLLVFAFLWAYFTFSEYLTEFYGNEPAGMRVLFAKLTEEFSPLFWAMWLFNFVVPFVMLSNRRTRTVRGTILTSILINIGMWLERYNIVVPTLTRPRLPSPVSSYLPTWTEWSVLLGSFALFAMLYVVFSKVFPIISIWEVREGGEIAARQAPGVHAAEAAAD